MTAKAAINGYGTIGKRVADAVAAQDDMELAGVEEGMEILGVVKQDMSFETFNTKRKLNDPYLTAKPQKKYIIEHRVKLDILWVPIYEVKTIITGNQITFMLNSIGFMFIGAGLGISDNSNNKIVYIFFGFFFVIVGLMIYHLFVNRQFIEWNIKKVRWA